MPGNVVKSRLGVLEALVLLCTIPETVKMLFNKAKDFADGVKVPNHLALNYRDYPGYPDGPKVNI